MRHRQGNLQEHAYVQEDWWPLLLLLAGKMDSPVIRMPHPNMAVQDLANWRFPRDDGASSSAPPPISNVAQDVEMSDAHAYESVDYFQYQLGFPLEYRGGYEQQHFEQPQYYEPSPP
ncbi:hypothetical protein Droror1_Dr00016468 [Drosera rotundifolia]